MDRTSERRERTSTRVDDRVARASVAAPAVLIGSLIVIVGTFLDWGSRTVSDATGTQTETVDLSGFNVPDGRIVMGIGFALLVVAVLMWANKRVESWFDADLLGVALSTFAIGTIVAFLIDGGDTGRSVEIGTYVSLAGALIAFIGGIAALLRSGSDRATVDDEGRGDIGRRRAA
jgi:cellobiose-specific phosphotransferase system component IIC